MVDEIMTSASSQSLYDAAFFTFGTLQASLEVSLLPLIMANLPLCGHKSAVCVVECCLRIFMAHLSRPSSPPTYGEPAYPKLVETFNRS